MKAPSISPEKALILKERLDRMKGNLEGFINWLPLSKRDIFIEMSENGNISEIARKFGYYRQQIYNIRDKYIKEYRLFKGIEVDNE